MIAFMNNVMKNFLSQLFIKNVHVVKNEHFNYIVQIEIYRLFLFYMSEIYQIILFVVYIYIYIGINMLTCLNTPTSILVQK